MSCRRCHCRPSWAQGAAANTATAAEHVDLLCRGLHCPKLGKPDKEQRRTAASFAPAKASAWRVPQGQSSRNLQQDQGRWVRFKTLLIFWPIGSQWRSTSRSRDEQERHLDLGRVQKDSRFGKPWATWYPRFRRGWPVWRLLEHARIRTHSGTATRLGSCSGPSSGQKQLFFAF